MIDPTDSNRNVAAALSLDQFYVFVDAARGFLAEPSIECFFAEPAPRTDKQDVVAAMEARGTDLLAIVFEIPDMVEDIVYPQLYKMRESVLVLLSEHEFTVLGSAAGVLPASETTDTVVLLIELVSGKLPPLRKHAGPPAYMRKHAERFKMNLADEYTFLMCISRTGGMLSISAGRTDQQKTCLSLNFIPARLGNSCARKPARDMLCLRGGRSLTRSILRF
jgi:tRNA nucleotidyltransferase (CCA-adding enzyme)